MKMCEVLRFGAGYNISWNFLLFLLCFSLMKEPLFYAKGLMTFTIVFTAMNKNNYFLPEEV